MTSRLAPASAYKAAFAALAERGLAESCRTMLAAHYAMSGHVATMRYLCAAIGRPAEYRAGNLIYGGLAKRVRLELGLPFLGLELGTLATYPEDPIDALGEFSFRMRPEVCRALESLGWVRSGARTPRPRRDLPRTAVEGARREQLVAHRRRERGLREAKIAEALTRSRDGRLRCEVPGCGFDFERTYGAARRGYIQIHHMKPLGDWAKGERPRLEELALVCANCHAMIHAGGRSRRLETLIVRW
ncbi:MAG: HNH endonuclease [Gemmatimonadales bacterium]|nr:HNH endonuclease [Gemmatimonadales bacterium]